MSTPLSCGCPSGTPFNPPTPGSLVVVPYGSQVVQTPQVYPCGGEAVQSTGSVAGGEATSSSNAASAFAYPMVKSDFNMVGVDASGSFLSQNALLWAIVGASVWIAPLGYVTITGVSGEVVSFKNVNVPGGTLIRAGSNLLISPPSINSGSVGEVNALNVINGSLNGDPGTLRGQEGQMLKVVSGRWQASAGKVYAPLTTPVNVFSETFGSGAMTATRTLTLPNLPNPLPPLLAVAMTIQLYGNSYDHTTLAWGFEVKKGGIVLASLHSFQSVAHPIVTLDGTVSPLCQLNFEKGGTSQASASIHVHGYFF